MVFVFSYINELLYPKLHFSLLFVSICSECFGYTQNGALHKMKIIMIRIIMILFTC
ncbi:hypothetical protein FLJC2902T_15890 [Flavobacterium limnosediminis JC2902]|uniref:Uncharacterized protein n=1 Tax=Flavobacterium limnosediminis JC2902 TaxID=1341181 RepID=V6SPV4_9FLAO|nr:hypothetical protein FLJC2902T_15890 [Flavobacterium limnosediminis JC2902]